MASSFVVNATSKKITTTARWVYRSVEDVTFTLSDGGDWPAGSYTLAFSAADGTTYATTASSGSTALTGDDSATLSGSINLNTTSLATAFAKVPGSSITGLLALVEASSGARYIIREWTVYDDGWNSGAAVSGQPGYYSADDIDDLFIAKGTGTTKGDVLAWASSGNPARLPVGADGQALTARTAATAGVRWETPSAAAVESVFGRTGAVAAAAQDYSATQLFTTTIGLGSLSGAAAPGLTPHMMHSATVANNITSWGPTGLRNGDAAGIKLRNASYAVATTGLTGWPGYAATSMATIATNGAILMIQRLGATYYGVA